MGLVLFYRLTRSGLAETVAQLAGRSLDAGWRVAVRGRDPGTIDRLDDQLWRQPEDGFLPHGRADQPRAADQPVLLTTTGGLPNGARCLLVLDGVEIAETEAGGLERVCILFDGHDPDAVAAARGQWRRLTAAGLAAQFWADDSGRWEKQAEHPPPG